jgi:hypothetical protein
MRAAAMLQKMVLLDYGGAYMRRHREQRECDCLEGVVMAQRGGYSELGCICGCLADPRLHPIAPSSS